MIPSIEKVNNYYKSTKGKIKVLTFQSQDVLNTLLENGEYIVDTSLSRERRNYKLDVEQLNGSNPIWCFSPVGLKTKFLNKFVWDDFRDGTIFGRFKSEMSANNNTIENLILLELEVNVQSIRVGLTHNAYIAAVVIPKIEKQDLIATYKLSYDRSREGGWYYADVAILNKYCNDCLFENNFSCREQDEPIRKEGNKRVTLYRGCNNSELEFIITKEFSPLTWWSTDIRDAGHYYEGTCIQLELLENPQEQMDYLQNEEDSPNNYTFGSAEMECPKDSIWYSISNKYIKENAIQIREVEPEYYDWELEEMQEDETLTKDMNLF